MLERSPRLQMDIAEIWQKLAGSGQSEFPKLGKFWSNSLKFGGIW
jgi:hypothetical protein